MCPRLPACNVAVNGKALIDCSYQAGVGQCAGCGGVPAFIACAQNAPDFLVTDTAQRAHPAL